MVAYYLDTNVVIDYASKREPFYSDAKTIFELAETGSYKFGIGFITFPTLFYICKKRYSPSLLIAISSEIRRVMKVLTATEESLIWAENSGFSDLEDAMQNHIAESNGYKTIITRNKKDFKKSNLAILTPEEFLATL